MGEGIILDTGINLAGFARGSKQLANAIKSLVSKVTSIGKSTEQMAGQMMSPLKRLLPTILGIGSAYGIISKAVSAFMAENQALSQQMSSIWSSLGNLLGPIITQIINWVSTAVAYFLQFLKLLGIASAGAQKAAKGAGGAANELKKTLAGFDELNVLNDNNGGGGGTGSGKLPEVELKDWMKALAEALKNKMWDDAADIIIQKFNGLIATVKSKANEFGKYIGEYVGGALHILSRIVKEFDWKGIGESAALFLNGILEQINKIDPYAIGNLLVAKFTIPFRILIGFLETVDAVELSTAFSGMIKGALQALIDTLNSANWTLIGNKIKQFFDSVDWVGIKEKLKELLVTAWNAAWDLFLGIMGEGTKDELPVVKYFREVKTAIEDLATTASPILGDLWNNIVKPLISSVTITFLEQTANAIKLVTEALDTLYNLTTGRVTLREYIAAEVKGTDVLPHADRNFETTTGFLGRPLEAARGGQGVVPGLANEYAEAGLAVKQFGDDVQNASTKLDTTSKSYDDIGSRAKSSSIQVKEANEEFENTEKKLEPIPQKANEASEAIQKMAEDIVTTSDNLEQMQAKVDAIDKVGESITKLAQTTTSATQEITQDFEKWSNAEEKVGQSTSKLSEIISSSLNSIKEIVSSAVSDVQDSVSSRLSGMESDVQAHLFSINSIISNTLSSIAGYAGVWGADLMINFINGIYSMASQLAAACADMAGIVNSYLGFSEPDIGPLSDFHTYGPDMMKLYASGIEGEKGRVVAAVSDVAEMVSDTMSGGAFQMPVVAGGGFLPYGIGAQEVGGFGGGEINSEILAAILALQELIVRFENAVDNMQWVAEFGNVRAVVKEITKIQKQIDRAGGV